MLNYEDDTWLPSESKTPKTIRNLFKDMPKKRKVIILDATWPEIVEIVKLKLD